MTKTYGDIEERQSISFILFFFFFIFIELIMIVNWPLNTYAIRNYFFKSKKDVLFNEPRHKRNPLLHMQKQRCIGHLISAIDSLQRQYIPPHANIINLLFPAPSHLLSSLFVSGLVKNAKDRFLRDSA